MTTPLPEWMPALPRVQLDHFVGWHGRAGAEMMMLNYGRQCVEAYKASLKPWTLEGTAEELRAAAYRAGQEAMRERAAKHHKRNHLDVCRCGRCREVERIRALPVDAD